MEFVKCWYGTEYNKLLCLFTNSLIFAFLWELALSKIINLFLNLVVMCSCKKSYNLLLSIPLLSYKCQPKTPSVDIENG